MQIQTTEKKTKDAKAHFYQSEVLRSTRRFIALIAGTGGGKTFTGPLWLYQEIAKYPKDQFFVIAPTYKMLTRATIPTLVDMFRGTDAEGTYNQSKGLYELSQGAKIWFGSADRPETLEAGQYRAAWLDEAGQMKYMVWIVMQARLGFLEGRALLTTTPYSLNWLYTEFYQRWLKGDKNYDIIQFESISNPYYPKQEFQRAKEALSPQLFDMRYRGQFRKMEGLVYPDFNRDHIIEPFKIPVEWRRQGAADFGFNNPHVTLKGAVDDDDILYIYDEWYKSKMLLSVHAECMRDIRFVGDPSGKREIEELLDLGVRISSGDNDVGVGLQKVNERIRSQRLRIFKTCKNLIDEFEMYHWEEGKDKPHKENDHCLDALRYLIMEVEREKGESSWTYHLGMTEEKKLMEKEEKEQKEEDKAKKEVERAKSAQQGKIEAMRVPVDVELAVPRGKGMGDSKGEDEKKEKPKRESDDDSWVI